MEDGDRHGDDRAAASAAGAIVGQPRLGPTAHVGALTVAEDERRDPFGPTELGYAEPPPSRPSRPSRLREWARRAWVRIVASRADIAGALLSCVGLLIVFAPVLIGGKTLSSAAFTAGTNGFDPPTGQQPVPGDVTRLDVAASPWVLEPWAEVTARQLHDGTLPLWNQYEGIGAPLAANMQSAVFDPVALAVNLHPTQRTWDLTIIGALMLGAISTYALCRVLGMGYLAAVTGATIFSLSGYFSLYSNDAFIRGYAYLPVTCLVVEWIARTKRLLPIVALGLATFGCIVVGMPEIAFFVLVLAGLYGLWRSVWGPRIRSTWKTIGALAAGFGFGLALAAPLLGLFLQYERVSFNAHSTESGMGAKTDPYRLLLNWLVPFLNGDTRNATFAPGSWNGTRSWIGGAAFALVLFGVAARTRAAKVVVPFFGAIALLLFAKVYGLSVLAWVGHLPLVERIAISAWGIPIGGFALAMVAAAGVDGIRRREVSMPWLLGSLVAGGCGLYLVVRANHPTLMALPGDQVVRNFALATAGFVAVVVLALAVRPRLAAYLVAAVVLLELAVLAPNPFADRADPYVAPAWVNAIKADSAAQPYERVFALDAKLYPETGNAYGLADIRLMDALYIARYFTYAQTFLDPSITDRFVGGPFGSTEQGSAFNDNPMFDLLGVRYIVAAQDINQAVQLRDLLGSTPTTPTLDVRPVTVGGDKRAAIFEHAPGEVRLSLPSPFVGSLAFDYGVDDAAARDPASDGVRFSVVGTHRSGARETLWTGLYAPGQPDDPEVPGWRTGNVEVTDSADPIVQLALATDPRGNPSTDWAAWSEVRLDGQDGASLTTTPFKELGDYDGTYVFENPDATPRSFIVHEATVVPDFDAAQKAFLAASGRFDNGALRVDGLDVRRTAVVEASDERIPAALRDGTACPEGAAADDVRIVSYEADEVRVEVDTPCPGLLVLSDAYFPGWQASVNGHAADIHPTDLALRGVVVGEGRSDVVFRYRPAPFRAGILVAVAAVVAMVATAIVLALRRRRATATEPA